MDEQQPRKSEPSGRRTGRGGVKGRRPQQDRRDGRGDSRGSSSNANGRGTAGASIKGRRGRGRGSSRGRGGNERQQEEERPLSSLNRAKKNGQTTTTSNNKNQQSKSNRPNENLPYAPHEGFQDCLARYAAKDPTLIRGRLRVLPLKDGMAFVTCDRGSLRKDALLETPLERNRALDGDTVFVELLPEEDGDTPSSTVAEITDTLANLQLLEEEQLREETWQDDNVQRRLWDPIVRVRRAPEQQQPTTATDDLQQRKGKVICVVPPKSAGGNELNPGDESYRHRAPRRAIVGTLRKIGGQNNANPKFLLVPNNKSLPEFLCHSSIPQRNKDKKGDDKDDDSKALYKAEYEYGSWKATHFWPPCVNLQRMGTACNVEDETMALLIEHGVDHGDFDGDVFKDVERAVQSGMILPQQHDSGEEGFSLSSARDLQWKPTPEMYNGRRDYREERIFTIDPTTAKDLDDALHIKQLHDGRVEIGVHIADVSYFVQPDTAVDMEAQRRATTVYLVDRTVPMLPRPLCEVACSLNENVERLAFSCVWTMNLDGTLENPQRRRENNKENEVWYGRTVIKSCARLDYATAQNILEGKVANGEPPEKIDEALWPKSRRPTGGHTLDEVAMDVRLMNRVAKARRSLRFESGALALNGTKLAFKLDNDGETPLLCAPYPIRDSNRLVEEYMLLANYLVAQRLITHAGGLALLRHHMPPVKKGLDSVIDIAKEGMGFDINATSSQSLQASLSRLGRDCQDELVLQCVTEMLMAPMQPADYIAAGEVEDELWRHFALCIPYYTHFTSPIRRYPDIVVHRLLQATIDGQESVDSFPLAQTEVHAVCSHCNDKRMKSKKAQERSDRVFLALYLRRNPLKSQLGVVLSVGQKTFTVFVPSLGLSTLVFLDEHKDRFKFEAYTVGDARRILVEKKEGTRNRSQEERRSNDGGWSKLVIKVFAKLQVTCRCKEKPPIDVKVVVEGPWRED